MKLPDKTDLLIIGGGPAGTAAAFRAKELGINALVIDFDDVLKRIRDYAKDKLILPNFGGGDKMRFPRGGDLLRHLHFSPIDKDDMHQYWRQLYEKHQVPLAIGVELLGVTRNEAAGCYDVQTKDHNAKVQHIIQARHIVLAIGRGFPRRFDIPGNTDDIAPHLTDAAYYVNKPSCVIGGGTSAAEAVIAISNAKAAAGDESPVYWSYRGNKMPRVSAALAEAFFDAYIGNGNVRHYANSEPVAVLVGADKLNYLSIQVDRKETPGMPAETANLEFLTENVIACIGEDLPEKLLNKLGIEMVTGGPKNKKRMVVTPLLETSRANIYMIGDILSQAHLVTDDFTADPAGFQEIVHRGNIKSALIDGVLVAEVVAQKLAGKTVISVELSFVDEGNDDTNASVVTPGSAAAPAAPEPMASATVIRNALDASVMAEPETDTGMALVSILTNGVDGDEYPLPDAAVITLGQKNCDINFSEDTMLSDQHASILRTENGYFLRDDGSVNGVYLRASGGKVIEVDPGTLVRLGKQMLVFRKDDKGFSMLHYNERGELQRIYQVSEKPQILGREAPDITLDKNDRALSRRHMSVSLRNNVITIRDLSSINGTYIKVEQRQILPEDAFRLGQQYLRLVNRAAAQHAGIATPQQTIIFTASSPAVGKSPVVSPPKAQSVAPPAAPATPPPAAAPVAPATAGEMTINFRNHGKICPFKPGQTICEVAEKNGIPIESECHAGSCGSDPVLIIEGGEHLGDVDDIEEISLEDLDLEPGKYRLACMARPKKSIVVEVVKNKS